MKLIKTHPLTKIMSSTFIDLPSPSSINFSWNFGSLLGIILAFQLITGILLTFHYTPDSNLAFNSIIMSSRNNPNFWLIRWIHANEASLMFMLVYLHIARNMYFSSFTKKETWASGITIYLTMMAIAFLGYVLPWGQSSFWGVTVITNLLSAIPYVGPDIVSWLWGGHSVNNPTLKRFFSLHYLLPFILVALVIFHLMSLHQTGSSNPLNIQSKNDMLIFHPFFTMKDSMGFIMTLFLLLSISFINPLMFNDPENFTLANPMITPIHIQPEWYFLFAYAILRSIPNKIGGVIALLLSISILYTPLFLNPNTNPIKFTPLKKMIFWNFIVTFFILTWIGMNPVDPPYILIGMIFSLTYFLLFSTLFFIL